MAQYAAWSGSLRKIAKKSLLWLCLFSGFVPLSSPAESLCFNGTDGPGSGKHIVFLAGDDEYRSEEALPMLAKILAFRYGFKCTVLFSIDPATATINPAATTNMPGLEALKSADLCFMFLRFRELPDEQMKRFVDYLESGKPILALRTSTHAFAYDLKKGSPYAKFDWRSKTWPGGFGQQVLGETWAGHHGDHGKQSTRGIMASEQDPVAHRPRAATLEILNGVKDIWGPTDVYTVVHLPENAEVLVWGQVLEGMKPEDPPVQGAKNNPMMPLVWLRQYTGAQGKKTTVMTSTIGAAVDLQSEDLRRLLVNGCYYLTGLRVPEKADVRYVGAYDPSYFGFGKFKPGIKPSDLQQAN